MNDIDETIEAEEIPQDDGDRAYDAMKDREVARFFTQLDNMFKSQDLEFLKHLYKNEADYLINQGKPLPQFVWNLRWVIDRLENKPLTPMDKPKRSYDD